MRSRHSLGSSVGHQIAKLLCGKHSSALIVVGTLALAGSSSAYLAQAQGSVSAAHSSSSPVAGACVAGDAMYTGLSPATSYLYCFQNAPK